MVVPATALSDACRPVPPKGTGAATGSSVRPKALARNSGPPRVPPSTGGQSVGSTGIEALTAAPRGCGGGGDVSAVVSAVVSAAAPAPLALASVGHARGARGEDEGAAGGS